MASCNFYFYEGCIKMYCEVHDALLYAKRRSVKSHFKKFHVVNESVPDYLTNQVPIMAVNSLWRHALIEDDFTVPHPLSTINVCGVCGYGTKRYSAIAHATHMRVTHGVMAGGTGTRSAEAYIIPDHGVILKRLLPNHSDPENSLHRAIRSSNKRIPRPGENIEVVAEPNIQEAVAEPDVQDFMVKLREISDEFFIRNPNIEDEPIPKKPRYGIHPSRQRYNNPALFGIGLFQAHEDMSQAKLKILFDLACTTETTPEEHLFLRSFIVILRNTPGFLLQTNQVLRKSLTHTQLPTAVGENDDHITGRGFGYVLPSTLRRYTRTTIPVILVMLRLLSLTPNTQALKDELTSSLELMDYDDAEVKVRPKILALLKACILDRPLKDQTILLIAVKAASVRARGFGSGDEVTVNYEVKPIHDLSFLLASTKYCITSIMLYIYFGHIDQGNTTTEIVKKFSTSLSLNLINVCISNTKSLKLPGKEKVYYRRGDNGSIEYIFRDNHELKLGLEDIKDAFNVGVRIVKESLSELFGDMVSQFFFPGTGKNVKLKFNDIHRISFVSDTPEVTDLVSAAEEKIKERLASEGEEVDEVDDETIQKELLEVLEQISVTILALCSLSGDGSRRAAEYRDFTTVESRESGQIRVVIRPNGYSFLDWRIVAKRPDAHKSRPKLADIRHNIIVSNLLILQVHFINKIREHYWNEDATYHFFPIKGRPKKPLLNNLFKEFGGGETKEADQNLEVESINYSEEYSIRANKGLSRIFDGIAHEGLSMTYEELRTMQVSLQQSLNEMSGDWDHFEKATQNLDMVQETQLASASGHSVRTRTQWYRPVDNVSAGITSSATSKKKEEIADKISFLIFGVTPLITEVEIISLGEEPDLDVIVQDVLTGLGHPEPKCAEQAQLIKEVYKIIRPRTSAACKAVIASIRCGGGKSIAIDTALKYKSGNSIVILLLPTLVLIGQKHREYSNRVRCLENSCERLENVDLVILSYDKAFSDRFISSLIKFRERICTFIIDEAHTLLDSAFRTRLFRAEYIFQYRIPTIFLSGTLPLVLKRALETRFCLSTAIYISGSLINSNITYKVMKIKAGNTAAFIELLKPKIDQLCDDHREERLLCICGTIPQVEALVESEFTGRNTYKIHRNKTTQENAETLENYKGDNTGILFATAAIGEGMDIPNQNVVVVVGTAYSILKQMQYASRCGRRNGIRGLAYIYFHEKTGIIDLDELVKESQNMALVPISHYHPTKHLLTESGFKEWVNNRYACRLTTLARALGEDFGEPACGNCDVCTSIPIVAQGDEHTNVITNSRIKINRVLAMLKRSCLICMKADCCLYAAGNNTFANNANNPPANANNPPANNRTNNNNPATETVMKCKVFEEYIEGLEKTRYRYNHPLLTPNQSIYCASCSQCYQPFGDTNFQMCMNKKHIHNSSRQRTYDENSAGICTKLNPDNREAAACATCYFPHDFIEGQLETGHLTKTQAVRLRSVISFLVRSAPWCRYFDNTFGIGFAQEDLPFNSKFVEACKARMHGPLGFLPNSIVLIDSVMEKRKLALNYGYYPHPKYLTNYDLETNRFI